MSLAGLLLLTGCTKGDDGDQPLPTVKAQFTFSLPFQHAKAQTRMEGGVVQKDGTEEEFRGMSDVKLFCYNTEPTQSTSKIGNIIEIKTSGEEVSEEITENDMAQCQEISIPVTTSYFGFYARATDAPVTHEDKMKYGVIETVGLGRTTYQDNSTIRFKPVSICTSDDPFGGSAKGAALLDLLNDVVGTTASVAAPNDKWATVQDIFLNEAYQRLTALKALSTEHVQVLLATVNQILYMESPDTYGDALRAALIEKIASYCTEAPTATSTTITLKPDYQGYPADIHLPTGAARVEWDADQKAFVVPDTHSYGANINIAALDNYVYPMNLQFQIMSDIVASDNLVINNEEQSSETYDDWDDLLEHGYAGAKKQVDQTTMSVAMVKQVEYAVGRIALRVRIATADNIYDAKNQIVDVSNGFKLTGYLIGGQREVDYNFQPVAGSKTYAIYDSYMTGSTPTVKRYYYTEPSYILGLSTDKNQKINMALELVNNGDPFWGDDGVIAHNTTFYLVAELDPASGYTNNSTSLNQIFDRDHATQVNLTITSLRTATYGLPNLDLPQPTVGVSVNLLWEDGLWFDDIEL